MVLQIVTHFLINSHPPRLNLHQLEKVLCKLLLFGELFSICTLHLTQLLSYSESVPLLREISQFLHM